MVIWGEMGQMNAGLYNERKLTREHLVLTLYSRVTVCLAEQVMYFCIKVAALMF